MALLNTVLCIVNGVREAGHGGTVLLVAPESTHTLPVRVKFAVEDSGHVLADRFVDFLNARHRLASARWELRKGLGDAGESMPDSWVAETAERISSADPAQRG